MKDNPNYQKALQVLNQNFGYQSFRSPQWEIIQDVLNKKDTLVLMPTGGGKSLCFQIPALLMPGTVVVISPLISLMKDQVQALHANGIAADYYNSSQSSEEQKMVEEKLLNQEIKLLYVSPETFSSDVFISMICACTISLIAIDEAHCISSWGHDFRPEYGQIGKFRDKLSNIPFIALTATADKITRSDIIQRLNLKDVQAYISSFDRPNLSLNVLPGKNRWDNILALIMERRNQCGIIYCTSRKSCENLAEKLIDKGFNALPYHAGLHKDVRSKTQEDFINDEVQIVVATVAFGMGIDKSNVRWVIHYNLPKNIESYYQEIGRAGRDGAPADTFLFSTYADMLRIKEFIAQGGQQEFQEAKLQRLMDYADARICRRKVLLNYFGEVITENCGNCDVCDNPPKVFDGTVIAQKALSAIVRLHEKEILNVVIEVLKGSSRAEIYQKGYHKIKTFGVGSDYSYEDWKQYMMQLINLGYVDIAYDQKNALKITPLGKKVLFEQQKVALTAAVLHKKKPENTKVSAKKNFRFSNIDKELFEKMRQLRLSLAKSEKKAPYMIFSDATLQQLAAIQPQQLNELLQIEGIGNYKKDLYGKKFLEVIQNH